MFDYPNRTSADDAMIRLAKKVLEHSPFEMVTKYPKSAGPVQMHRCIWCGCVSEFGKHTDECVWANAALARHAEIRGEGR